MATHTQRETAKIYAFPTTIRPSVRRASDQPAIVAQFPRKIAEFVDFGSGWYHDAAIQEAQSQAKR